jgi:6-phosphogluconate dehydrogenase
LASAITYAQGFSLIAAASVVLNFGTSLEDVARVWRGGCIIRAAMLDDIVATYGDSRHTGDLMASSFLAKLAREHHTSLRSIAATAIASGIPVPAFAASLSYFDAYRSTKLPLNLVQAQRDCFGAHTYERTDRSGAFHTEWLS